MPPALAALSLSPDEVTTAASEVGQRLVLRGILPPDMPTRGMPSQIVAGIQRGAFGVGATFGDALGVLFPDTGKGITDFFKSYQMQSSGGMIEQAAETATQSLGVLGAAALGMSAGGVPALTGLGVGTLSAIATPAVFGLAQATQTRDLLHAINQEVTKRGGRPLTSGEIAAAMATNGAIEFGGEFISDILFAKRFFPGSAAFQGAKQAVRAYLVNPEVNAAIRMVARATEESVRAGLREAPEEFLQNLGEAAVTRGIVGPERLRQAQAAGIQVPGAPLEEGFQAAKIALLAGPFFAAGGAAASRMLRGRSATESQPDPPQGAPAGDVAEAARPAVTPATAPMVAPPPSAAGVAQAQAPGAVPSAGIPGAPGRQGAAQVGPPFNPLTGEGVSPSVQSGPLPAGAGVVVNPLTGEQVPLTPDDAARYAGTPLLGVRPLGEQGPEGAPAGPPSPVAVETPPAAAGAPLSEAEQSMLPDLVSALRNLGYTQRDATTAAQQAVAQHPASLEEAIGVALRPHAEGISRTTAPAATREISPAQVPRVGTSVLLLSTDGVVQNQIPYTVRAIEQGPDGQLYATFAETSVGWPIAQLEAIRQPQELQEPLAQRPVSHPVPEIAPEVQVAAQAARGEAAPVPVQPSLGEQPLVDTSQLAEQERATQAQITREGVEAEARTRLRPTVEQAPPSGFFEQEQALPFQEAPPPPQQSNPAAPPQALALPREAPALGRALADLYAGPLQRMTEQGLTLGQMHTVVANELRERFGGEELQRVMQSAADGGMTGNDALVRFIDSAIDQAYGLPSEGEAQQQALRASEEGPDILAAIRQVDDAGRFGIKVTKATAIEREFRDLIGIAEGGRRAVARLMNNRSGFTPQEMANRLADLGYLPAASEEGLLEHLRERLGTGRHMGPRYQPGGIAEPPAVFSRLVRRPTPGGDRADATMTTKRQAAAIPARLQHIADGETIIATTMQAEPGRRVVIPGVRRREGTIEVVRTIAPHTALAEMRTTGSVAFVGQTIREGQAGTRDIAVLGQLVRDPEVEHLHYILTGEAGRVLRVIEVSSRLPGSAAPFVKAAGQVLGPTFMARGMRDLQTQMRQSGATGFWLLHNHPSGNPSPSEADVNTTRRLAAVPGFQGHVVIDSGRYATINADGEQTMASLPTTRPDPFLQPSLGLPFAGVDIKTTEDAAAVGRAFANPGFVTLVLLNKRPGGQTNGVRGVLLLPEGVVTQPHDHLTGYINAVESEFGAVLATAYYDGTNPAVHRAAELLYRDGVLNDYVMAMPQGGKVSLAEEMPGLALDPRLALARRVEAAAGEQIQDASLDELRRMFLARGGVESGQGISIRALSPEEMRRLAPLAEAVHRLLVERGVAAETLDNQLDFLGLAHLRRTGEMLSAPDAEALLRRGGVLGGIETALASGMLTKESEDRYRLTPSGQAALFVERWLGRPGQAQVEEEAPTLDIPNTIQGVTVAQAGKLATAYRMMFDVGHSLHSSHIQRPLSQATFQKLRIRWAQMEDIGQQMLLRFMQHPEDLDAIRRRLHQDPTAGLSTAENAGLVQWTMTMMDDLDVKRSLGEIDQATFDQEWDAIIKNALLIPAAASSAGRTLALQRRFQQVGASTITDFVRREERARGRALTDDEKRQAVGDFFDVLRTGDRDRIRDAMDKQTDPTLLNYYMEAYYGSLLSGLPTLNINTFGTLAHIAFQKFVVGPTAVGLDWMISGFSGQERQRYMREVFADFNATWKNAGQQYREAWYWWKSPFPQAVGGQGQLAQPAAALRQGIAMTRGGMRLDAGSGADAWMRAPTQNADGTPNTWGPIMRRLAPFVGAASRIMAASDAVMTNLAFQGEVVKLATREGINRFGIQDRQQVDNFVTHVSTHLVQYPEIESAAKAAAQADTFNDPAGKLAAALTGLRRAPQPFGFFFHLLTPFASTPDRLLARGAELVPGLGLPVAYREAGYTGRTGFAGNFRGWLADFRQGEPQAVEVAAKQIVGLMLSSMAALLWDKDLLTGPLPDDPQERQAWERQGKLPFAIKMGSNWVEYRRVEPFISMPFGALAAGLQAIKSLRENRLKQGLTLDASYMDDASSVAAGIALNLTKFVLDSSYFSGLASFFASVSRTSEGFATGLTQQLVSATLPLSGLLRNLNRSIEASGMLGTEPGVVLMRQRERVGEQYLRSIPGAAAGVRPRLDVFGQPVVSERPLLGAVGGLLSPIRRQVAQEDPVEATFERLHYHPGRPPRRQLETVVGRRIEDEEYDAYVERRGALARETMERVVGLPFFGALPQDKQLARVKQAFSQATRRARREVFGRPETTQERRQRFAEAELAAASGE